MEPYNTNKNVVSSETPYESDYLTKSTPVSQPEEITEVRGNYINNLPREVKVPLSEDEKQAIFNNFQSPLVSDKEIDNEVMNELYDNLEEFELEV